MIVTGYTEWIKFTPSELRGKFHSHALGCWQALQAEQCQEQCRQAKSLCLEPAPIANNGSWRCWLRETREHPLSMGTFSFLGIPLINQGYQTAHIKGMKAVLTFLPCKHRGSSTHGPLWDPFLRAAAMLLCVPGQYLDMLSCIGKEIHHECCPACVKLCWALWLDLSDDCDVWRKDEWRVSKA
jgi:hypothetical protein